MATRYIINAPNERFNRGELGELGADYSSSTTITLVNANNFAADDFIVIEYEGQEKAEIGQISSINADKKTVTLQAALKFSHDKGARVTKLYYNQRRLYRETASGSESYTLVETKSIQIDKPLGTEFIDSGGTAGLRYKVTYYNSGNGTETAIADSVAVYGGDTGHYCTLDEIINEAGFDSAENLDSSRVVILRTRAEAEVKSSLIYRYTLPLSETPDLINQITILLAAGWLMYASYGPEATGTDKDGIEKVKMARSMLKDIRLGNLLLLGSDGTIMTQKETPSISGYPNATTEYTPTDSNNDEDNTMFQVNKEF